MIVLEVVSKYTQQDKKVGLLGPVKEYRKFKDNERDWAERVAEAVARTLTYVNKVNLLLLDEGDSAKYPGDLLATFKKSSFCYYTADGNISGKPKLEGTYKKNLQLIFDDLVAELLEPEVYSAIEGLFGPKVIREKTQGQND